jgi:high-affinity iron transporter
MIEAAIIVSVLLSFVEQLMTSGRITSSARDNSLSPSGSGTNSVDDSPGETDDLKTRQVLIKRMRTQIWAGALIGFAIALCIGAAFIAVVR